ncbi:protein NLRC3-like protein [Lates japonicus]|uniref:Protein NLRC3-like protein n=1 Tax=Lates japonicus TaxID=270547 RepID=A0AAD3NCW3_LATJO|nr:protein NLRC3-like protein [Lates japonicus]
MTPSSGVIVEVEQLMAASSGPGPGPGPSCVSMKSNKSMNPPLNFKQSVDGSFRIQQQRPDSPEPSCLSLKSDVSKDWFINFKGRRPSADQM